MLASHTGVAHVLGVACPLCDGPPGTSLVLLFSDPMVDCLSALGERTSISPFYISFVLAPLASNASELLAAYKFALKKTQATITVSLSQLEGAAIMNNTFCLGIFMVLIFLQNLV
eukprot:COSAG05_NODE_13532_length_426_cov_1.262997_1_plen_114_part_01